MYRFLLTRQWVILTLLGLVLIPTMVRLGYWQLHRHEHRVANNEIITASLRTPPVPVERLTSPGAVVPRGDLYRPVTATGRYDAAHEVVARQRTSADGSDNGYHVITPLVLDDGKAVLVDRGWIPAGGDLTKLPTIPEAPAGEITVTGRLRPDETTATTGILDKPGLPDRMIMLINSGRLTTSSPEPLLGGYMELYGTSPAPGAGQPQLIPEPDHSGIGPHLAYAIQWWLFAAMVPVGWVILVRREREERLSAQPETGPEAGKGR